MEAVSPAREGRAYLSTGWRHQAIRGPPQWHVRGSSAYAPTSFLKLEKALRMCRIVGLHTADQMQAAALDICCCCGAPSEVNSFQQIHQQIRMHLLQLCICANTEVPCQQQMDASGKATCRGANITTKLSFVVHTMNSKSPSWASTPLTPTHAAAVLQIHSNHMLLL